MTLAPASWPWLLRHELRLSWRNVGGPRTWLVLVGGGLAWSAYHAAVWFMLRAVGEVDGLLPGTYLLGGALIWFLFTLMLSQAMVLSVGAFFERGDLDLVLSSPLPPGNVFIVRGLGVALGSTFLYALLLTPFAHVGLFVGQPGLLAIYPSLAALGLLASAIGMGGTSLLVRLLGARRARTAAQLLGALVGAVFFLASQANSLVSHERATRWFDQLRSTTPDGGPFGRSSPLWLPFDAMLGQPVALLTLVAIGVACFVLTARLMARRFLDGTQESTTTPAPPQVDVAIAPGRFRGSPRRVVLFKEWKLIGRDPQLIASSLLQVLYMLPLMFVWGRKTSADTVMLPALVMTAASLAAGLSWLTIAAEDAPELLAGAPVDFGSLLRVKLAAAVLPVWLLIAPAALYVSATRPVAALAFGLCVIGATLSTGTIQLAMPLRGSRRDLRRRSKGNGVGTVLELMTMAGWIAMTWCLLAAPAFTPLAAVPALAAPLAAWLLGRARRRAFAGG